MFSVAALVSKGMSALGVRSPLNNDENSANGGRIAKEVALARVSHAWVTFGGAISMPTFTW